MKWLAIERNKKKNAVNENYNLSTKQLAATLQWEGRGGFPTYFTFNEQ